MTDVAYTCRGCGNTLTRHVWGWEDPAYTVAGSGDFLCEATPQGAGEHAPVASCVDERHTWLSGMMHVHDEDVDHVAATRKIECGNCDATMGPGGTR